jgi:hypothetical protein
MRKILTSSLITLASLSLFLPSCVRYASERSLDCISLNMPKEEVIQRMNARGVARGAILNKHGQTIEVREYKIKQPTVFDLADPLLFVGGEIDTYWLFFYEGRLVRWGQAGDWEDAERIIYDVNFNIAHN